MTSVSLRFTLLAIAAFILGFMRLIGRDSIAFQAVAHCFVGGLFGAYFVARGRAYLALSLSLTILELVAFFITHR